MTDPLFEVKKGTAEADLKLIIEALRERERDFQTLITNIPGVVYRCLDDEHWTMKYLSPAIARLTGYSPSDFINNKVLSYSGACCTIHDRRCMLQVISLVSPICCML